MFAGMNPSARPSLAPHHMAMIPPDRLTEIQKEYFAELALIATNPEAIEVKDRRFAGKAWHSSWSKVIAATYLLNSKHLMSLAKAVDADESHIKIWYLWIRFRKHSYKIHRHRFS